MSRSCALRRRSQRPRRHHDPLCSNARFQHMRAITAEGKTASLGGLASHGRFRGEKSETVGFEQVQTHAYERLGTGPTAGQPLRPGVVGAVRIPGIFSFHDARRFRPLALPRCACGAHVATTDHWSLLRSIPGELTAKPPRLATSAKDFLFFSRVVCDRAHAADWGLVSVFPMFWPPSEPRVADWTARCVAQCETQKLGDLGEPWRLGGKKFTVLDGISYQASAGAPDGIPHETKMRRILRVRTSTLPRRCGRHSDRHVRNIHPPASLWPT
jgi:hypothetical protein